MIRLKSTALLIAICAASFLLMALASNRDAAVVDELAHIPAGYSYLKFHDYRLNPEHPPLFKALAAMPLLFLKLQFPIDNPHWTDETNGQWGVGGAFIFGVNSAAEIIKWARFVPMLITVALITATYFWAKKLFKDEWALLPALLVGLSPIFLAQGHYVTNDVSAALGIMVAMLTFGNLIQRPDLKNILFAALGFGLAQLMKFSALVLMPVFLLMVLIVAAARLKDGSRGLNSLKIIGGALAAVVLGFVLVVYPVYAYFISGYPQGRQVSETEQLIGFIKNPLAKIDISMAQVPIERPVAQYLLGILMTTLRVSGTNVTYFLGAVSDHGNRLYFPVVYGLKESLPVLVLEFLALGYVLYAGLRRIGRERFRYSDNGIHLLLMVFFIAAYWAISIISPLNIGVRHLIPTIPLLYILTSAAIRRWYLANPDVLKKTVLGTLLIWFGLETAFAFPYYLSYFNEIGGGVSGGYRYVTDSNYDWGQDMLALNSWMGKHPEVKKLAFDFFGASNPEYYLNGKYAPWTPDMGDPRKQGIGWFAVSINNLQNSYQPAASDYNRSSTYSWLAANRPIEPGMGGIPKPDFRIGTTIMVYKL